MLYQLSVLLEVVFATLAKGAEQDASDKDFKDIHTALPLSES